VSDCHWHGSGGEFTLPWGARSWTLKFDEPEPGLRCERDLWFSKLLSLNGLAAAGRFDSQVFSPATLVTVERYRSRVQATFAPPGWGGLTVRAAWSPSCAGVGVDLEIQAVASTVGELEAVEVFVQSQWRFCGETDQASVVGTHVRPRDVHSAALSYDGRETADDLRSLRTEPIIDPPTPVPFTPPGVESDFHYLEMAQPNDVARQIRQQARKPPLSLLESLTLRYGLFGHDFEKGVVFRARLRACWLRSKGDAMRAVRLHREFLDEPLPLGP
jgi:hypothetical protein